MKISNIYLICTVLLAIFVQSCSKMNDLHQPYLDKGEIIYAAKVDSISAKSGKGRIAHEIFITAQRVETVRIFWNDYTDSVDITIGNETGVTTKIIENLPEKGYIFQFVSIDKFGNKSLPYEVIGNVYGDRFQSLISNRQIKSVSGDASRNVTILWQNAVDHGVRCDLSYKDTTGVQVIRKVPMTESTTVIRDYLSGGLTYQTIILPEPASIDTFYTEWKTVPVFFQVKLDRSAWTVTGFSSQEPKEGDWGGGGLALNAIDGNLNTFWHTAWNVSPQPTYPHWFSVDMGKTVTIGSFVVNRRQGNGNAQTKHQFFTSEDGTNWVDAGTFAMNKDINDDQSFPILSHPKARYFKYVALEGPDKWGMLAEINVFEITQ